MPAGVVQQAITGAATEASNKLLEHFQDAIVHRGNPEENDPKLVEALRFGNFKHRGRQMRGLYSLKDIIVTTDVFAIPPEFSISSLDLRGPRFSKFNDSGSQLHKLAIWLAEKRAELKAKPAGESWSESDKLWNQYINALPTMQEYKDHGYPLAANDADLQKLHGLPRVGKIADWANIMKAHMKKDLALYNTNCGHRPKLDMSDALWGQISATHRVYECRGMMLAPIADSLNHAGADSNLYPMCQESDGLIWLSSKRNINKGEELTTDYSETREDDNATDLIQRYGMFEGAGRERWSEADCRRIDAAGISAEKGSPLLRTIGQLTKLSCTDGVGAGTHYVERLKMQALPVLLPPPSRVTGKTSRSHVCRVSRARLLDFL